jgi:uncharacterized membrane-anchored protein
MISLFFLGMFAGVAYFIFKIYRIYDVTQAEKYKFVKEFLTFFGKNVFRIFSIHLFSDSLITASVSLVLVVLTIINAAICCANFGKSLKPHRKSRYQVN